MARVLLVALGLIVTASLLAARTGPAAPAAKTGAESGFTHLDFRGVAIQLQHSAARADVAIRLVREVAALGADTVLICPTASMEHARAQAIFVDMRRTSTPEELSAILREARQLGLRTILMPLVLLSHPRGSEWRGVIEPPEWDDWWRQYRDYINQYADIAAANQVDLLMVGSELVSTEKFTSEWVETIKRIRQRFSGKLGYSANWDHYEPIRFWDQLDYVGMTSYYTLADRRNPSVDEIVKRWQPIRDKIFDWQRRIGKPVILTEVGWCSQEGAATAPWNYYQNTRASAAGLEEQRRLYEGFVQAWDGSQGLAGVVWWEWTNTAGGAEDFDYTPKGKPAEQLLKNWFEESCRRPAAETTGAQP